jgi:hypothetical protein
LNKKLICNFCKNVFDIIKKKCKSKLLEIENEKNKLIIEKNIKIEDLKKENEQLKLALNKIEGKLKKNGLNLDFYNSLIEIQNKNINVPLNGRRWFDNEDTKNFLLLLGFFSSIFLIFSL